MTFIQMTFTRLSLRRTALLSGKFGGPNLKLLINALSCVDAHFVADKLCSHFKNIFTCNNTQKAKSLRNEFEQAYESYCWLPMADVHRFDTELVSTVIGNLKHGKAPDINGLLCAEHLYFCHPSISLLLTKLFNLMMLYSYIPAGIRLFPSLNPRNVIANH